MKPKYDYEIADTEAGTVVNINEQIVRALLRDKYGKDAEESKLAALHEGYTNSVAGGLVAVRGKHEELRNRNAR